MKKVYFLFFLLVILFVVACDFSSYRFNHEDSLDSLRIERYDREEARYLTTGDYAALQEMNTTYHKQTRALIEDILGLGIVSDQGINKSLLEFYQDSTLQTVIHDAESKFADMTPLNDEMRTVFGKLKSEMPDMPIPEVYSQIGALNQSIVIDDRQIGISLDKYLGSDYPVYKKYYDAEQRKTMCPDYIVPDCVVFYLMSVYPLPEKLRSDQRNLDMKMATVMWVANQVCGKDCFSIPMIREVDSFYRKMAGKVSVSDLLKSVWWNNL